jgi:hypothetical protein
MGVAAPVVAGGVAGSCTTVAAGAGAVPVVSAVEDWLVTVWPTVA